MSDYDEPEFFSDEEDMLFIDDGQPELVDDLVLDTVHDPTYADDNAFEAFLDSDDFEWEYLDDYYDADPSAAQFSLRKRRPLHPVLGAALESKKRKRIVEDDGKGYLSQSISAGKHRKPAAVDESTFPGVVWRTHAHSASPTPLFEPGEGRPVAILKNWRESIVRKPRTDTDGARQPPPPSVIVPSKREYPGKSPKAYTEDGYQPDADSDTSDRAAGGLPPVSLVPTEDLPDGKNKGKKHASKRRKMAPSRLKETVSANDERKETSHASRALSPKPESATTEHASGSSRNDRDGGASSRSGKTGSRGKKRKAPSPHPEDKRKTSGRAAPSTEGSETQSQSQESAPARPARRSTRQRNKT